MRAWMMAMVVGLLPLASLAQPPPPPGPAPAAATGAAPDAAERPRSPAQQAQQDRMRSCNAEATARAVPAETRRAFMSECLAGRMPAAAAAPAAPPTPQDRMRTCNAEAGTRNLAGEPRRVFMRDCLSGSASPAPTRATAPPNNAATFPTEAAARTACAEDTVVWGNSESRVFHLQGSRFYGKTQNSAYLCRGPAEMAGYRAAR